MFCPKCASDVSDNADTGMATASSKPWMRVAACMAVIVAIAIALFSLSGCGGSNTKAPSSSGSSSSSSAEPVSTKSVDDYSWEELSEISEEISKEATEEDAIEVAKKYNLVSSSGKLDGTQTKTVQLTDGATATVQIAGFLHDDKTDGGKAGITFIFRDCIGEREMNPTSTNDGGWEKSQMRSYLGSEGLKLLPDDLRQKVVSVKKLTNNIGETGSVSSVTPTSDSLWLFSYTELCGTRNGSGYTTSLYNVLNAEGSQYKLFRDMSVKFDGSNSVLEKNLNGRSRAWWERSPDPAYPYAFEYVNSNGYPDGATYASLVEGVCPGFCI